MTVRQILNGVSDATIPDETLVKWVKENDHALRQLFPEDWTHQHDVDMALVGEGLINLGCVWKDEAHLWDCFWALERFGICEVSGRLLRRRLPQVH